MSEPLNSHELARFTPLNALSPDHLNEIARKARHHGFKSGQVLFREGQHMPEQWLLAAGTVEVSSSDGGGQRIQAGSEAALTAIDGGNPARRTAVARSEVTIYGIDRNLLDMMLTWDQTGSFSVTELDGEADDEPDTSDDWMVKLLQTEAFRHIPPANIQAIFMRMEPVAYEPGEDIIRQDEPGEYFYIIRDGRCRVTRTTSNRPNGIRLADLGPGNSFGEEALISDKPRNATVTMITAGTVMRLSKKDFNDLLNEPLQDQIDYDEAVQRVGAGAQWLDVRLPPEYRAGHIQGATNLPLVFLRMKAEKLDNVEYIVYCDTGSRSSAAAFLLTQRGFRAHVLRGGMAQVPEDVISHSQQ